MRSASASMVKICCAKKIGDTIIIINTVNDNEARAIELLNNFTAPKP